MRLTTLMQKSKYHKLLVIRPTPVIGLSNCKQTIYPVKAPLDISQKWFTFCALFSYLRKFIRRLSTHLRLKLSIHFSAICKKSICLQQLSYISLKSALSYKATCLPKPVCKPTPVKDFLTLCMDLYWWNDDLRDTATIALPFQTRFDNLSCAMTAKR